MRRIVVISLAAFAGLAGWASPADARLFSTTGPVIAILAGDLFLGEAEGSLGGSGTIKIQSRAKPDVSCRGRFSFSAELGGAGTLRCNDSTTATFQFQRLSLVQGYGTGRSSRGAVSFTYGLSASESEPYLTLPPDKALRLNGKDLTLVDTGQASLIASVPEVAPDVLLRNATLAVTAGLKRDKNFQTNSPEKIAERVESAMLPLFDVRHMTQLAVARNWRHASSEQQNALVAEFSALLVRTYSAALASQRDQVIEYRPLRIAPGETDVTVRSTVKRSGAERMTIDYDMEKTTAGWKVYDIRIAGISLITTYQSTFFQTVRDGGVDGLIQSLAVRNLRADAGLGPHDSGARAVLFMYAVMPSVFRGGR